jgi:hypothetical protein
MNKHVQISYPIALTKLTCAAVCLCVAQYIQIAPSQFFPNRDKHLCPAVCDCPASSFNPLLRLRLLRLEEIESRLRPRKPIRRIRKNPRHHWKSSYNLSSIVNSQGEVLSLKAAPSREKVAPARARRRASASIAAFTLIAPTSIPPRHNQLAQSHKHIHNASVPHGQHSRPARPALKLRDRKSTSPQPYQP